MKKEVSLNQLYSHSLKKENSYKDIESKIMLIDAFLICAFYEINKRDKEFILPKSGFNKYPNGKV